MQIKYQEMVTAFTRALPFISRLVRWKEMGPNLPKRKKELQPVLSNFYFNLISLNVKYVLGGEVRFCGNYLPRRFLKILTKYTLIVK